VLGALVIPVSGVIVARRDVRDARGLALGSKAVVTCLGRDVVAGVCGFVLLHRRRHTSDAIDFENVVQGFAPVRGLTVHSDPSAGVCAARTGRSTPEFWLWVFRWWTAAVELTTTHASASISAQLDGSARLRRKKMLPAPPPNCSHGTSVRRAGAVQRRNLRIVTLGVSGGR
jgi:hypothetical protein